jgi:acetoin utilization deacetylase AcuC-like enzyme
MKIITDDKCAGYSSPGHPERPARVTGTQEFLRSQKELQIVWAAPTGVDDAQILRAHSPQHLARLDEPEDFDGDTPFHEKISMPPPRSTR